MSNERYTISKQYCDGVGDGLRYAYGGTDHYYPSQWENAIKGLKKTLQAKTATPGASQQVIEPDSGYDGLSAVTISGDADLVAGNIKKDVEIFGVTGTFEGSDAGRVTQDENGYLILSEDGRIVAEIPVTITQNGSTTPPSGYAFSVVSTNVSGGGGGGVNIPVSLAVTTQPTKASYTTGETLDLTGIVVTATYADGTTGNVTSGCTFSPANGATLSTTGTQTITATYTVTDTSSGHNYTLTLTASTSVTVSVPSVKAKLGSSSTITTLSGLYGPLGNGANDYINPINSADQAVTLDLTQPFEIKVAFKLTQALSDSNNRAIISSADTGMPYVSINQKTELGQYNMTCQLYSSQSASSFRYFSTSEFLPVVNTEAYIRLVYDGTDVTVYGYDGSGSEVSKTFSDFGFMQIQAGHLRIAGSDTSNNSLAAVDGAYVDIDNTYIKQNGTKIWGI